MEPVELQCDELMMDQQMNGDGLAASYLTVMPIAKFSETDCMRRAEYSGFSAHLCRARNGVKWRYLQRSYRNLGRWVVSAGFFFCLCWKEGSRNKLQAIFFAFFHPFPLVPEKFEIYPLGRLNRHAWGKLHGSFPPPTFQKFNPTLNT